MPDFDFLTRTNQTCHLFRAAWRFVQGLLKDHLGSSIDRFKLLQSRERFLLNQIERIFQSVLGNLERMDLALRVGIPHGIRLLACLCSLTRTAATGSPLGRAPVNVGWGIEDADTY
jgi:hypothetical protein